jgi:pyruvate formate lyase activating enzyme
MDAEAHERCTGASNELVLANLKRLQQFDVEVCLRVPVIPALNDSRENLEAIARLVKELPIVKAVELLPYHRLGVNKYRKLGLEYPMDDRPSPGIEEMLELKEILDRQGIPCTVQG